MSDPLVMPADEGAEMAVVGSAMAAGGRVLEDARLTPEDFYRPAHADLWRLMLDMARRGEPIDQTSVHSRQVKEYPNHSGWLLELVTNYRFAVPNVGYHARVVREAAVRRRLIGACTRIIQDCHGPAGLDEVVDAARSGVEAAVSRVSTGGLPSFAERVADVMETLEAKDSERLFPTGWHDLDSMLSGGLRPGHLCVIGARPAVGKSVSATVAAASLADAKARVLFSSMEMSAAELTQRVMANTATVDLGRIIRRDVTEQDWAGFERQMYRFNRWDLVIDDAGHQTLASLRSRAREMQRAGGIDVVIVDYLQLMAGGRSETRQQAISALARGLKLLARDFDVPVVAVAQVGRKAEERLEGVPVMADLRESGDIENSADEVILLHRNEVQNPGVITFRVEKNRHGRTGSVELAWAPRLARIASMGRGAVA